MAWLVLNMPIITRLNRGQVIKYQLSIWIIEPEMTVDHHIKGAAFYGNL